MPNLYLLTMVRIIHIPMQDFQTIAHLIPNFGGRVDDPPAHVEDQNTLRTILISLLGQSAKFIQPVLFRSGRLIIYAEAAVWGQHIQHRHSRLMERCQADGLHITDICVKVRPGATTLPRHGDAHRAASYNTTSASKHLSKVAAQTEDPGLKQALLRLAKRIRENHRDEQDENRS